MNKNPKEHMDYLLFKSMEGDLSTQEQLELNDLLLEKPELQDDVELWSQVYDHKEELKDYNLESVLLKSPPTKPPYYKYLGGLILLLFMGSTYYFLSYKESFTTTDTEPHPSQEKSSRHSNDSESSKANPMRSDSQHEPITEGNASNEVGETVNNTSNDSENQPSHLSKNVVTQLSETSSENDLNPYQVNHQKNHNQLQRTEQKMTVDRLRETSNNAQSEVLPNTSSSSTSGTNKNESNNDSEINGMSTDLNQPNNSANDLNSSSTNSTKKDKATTIDDTESLQNDEESNHTKNSTNESKKTADNPLKTSKPLNNVPNMNNDPIESSTIPSNTTNTADTDKNLDPKKDEGSNEDDQPKKKNKGKSKSFNLHPDKDFVPVNDNF